MDSANVQGSLLEVVQILTDLNLTITKAYISSDGEWFIDGKILISENNFYLLDGLCLFLDASVTCVVFHVVDQDGNKLWDDKVVDRIQKVDSNQFPVEFTLSRL